ncbi:MAG: hypothetical protein M1826_005794 [Phylliscum demangeonii]|nr:MAG: hypothetical protein M1826_005794 [Phylliscum demangeonii]
MPDPAASPPPPPKEWLVVVPDHADALPRRLEVRQQHLANAVQRKQEGVFRMGGAILERHPPDDDDDGDGLIAFAGSALVVRADSRDGLMEILRADIYATAGVWDLAKAQIYPANPLGDRMVMVL